MGYGSGLPHPRGRGTALAGLPVLGAAIRGRCQRRPVRSDAGVGPGLCAGRSGARPLEIRGVRAVGWAAGGQSRG